MIHALTIAFYVIGIALLAMAPIQQARIVFSHMSPGPDADTKWAFLAHGIASFGALAFHILRMDFFCSACFLVVGLVASWTYWIRPLYK